MYKRIYCYIFSVLIVGLLLFAGLTEVKAQCLQSSFTPGRVFKTTGNYYLDQKFNEESFLIASVFGVQPNLLIYDDSQGANALAVPVNTLYGANGTVLFGARLLREELWSMDKGGQAVAGIMAHEFAHILQIKSGSRLTTKYRELQADFLAGYYLGRKSYLLTTDIKSFAHSLYEKGDYNFWSPQHHGTPLERVAAMVAGFRARELPLWQAYSVSESFVLSL